VGDARRTDRERSARAGPSDVGSLLHLGTTYWLSIHQHVRRELAVWDMHARNIPDPLLREQALGKLSGERLNPEAAALFAGLAPRGQRRRIVSLIVAYQVLYDYLDGVNEQPGFNQLQSGLQLHRALTEAVLLDRPVSDHYLCHHDLDDGGYMRALCVACRRIVERIPSIGRSGGVIEAATERCGQAQSLNHAPGETDRLHLIEWSRQQAPRSGGYLWWELAAGGISCLNIHAVLASTAHPRSSPQDAARVDAAYFPSVCSLSALLDSLADYHVDACTGNHSFIAYYRDEEHAAERLAAIAVEAGSMIASLRHSPRHRIILAGIVAYYLSSPSVWEGFPAAAAERLMGRVGTLGALMCAVMKTRRRLHDRAVSEPRQPPRLIRVLVEPGSAGRARP
jgi:tetraprenyl-beta-curcumene synthase